MNAHISIGASQNIDLLKNSLSRQFRVLERDGLKVEINELPRGKYTFLQCCLNKDSPQKHGENGYRIFKNYVASVVSDVILNKWESIIINDIIRDNYYYFDESERRLILENVQKYIQGNGANGISRNVLRRNQIYQRLCEFLNTNDQLVVEGFIRFRLKEYISELRNAIENAVDDFLMEKEYGEFIQLLRYFVEIQDPRVDITHVVAKSNGHFCLYDDKKQNISNDYLEDVVMQIDNEISYEDLLISALISISPRKIVFHYQENNFPASTVKTIKEVFVGRVETCTGCEWCQNEIK